MIGIVPATTAYQAWLATYIPVVGPDLVAKHELMASGVFPFFRGTAYRWAERWPIVCDELTDAPSVLGVGDLHVENFGTWRDAEGRLVWGVNDVDETADMPYTNDLVRLVASALVAAADARMTVGTEEAAAAVLAGYTATLGDGGQPFVLAEHHRILGDLATAAIKDPERYWTKLQSLPAESESPAEMTAAARTALPAGTTDIRVGHRMAGVGSLGRPRVVATGTLCGSTIAREAKAIVPSAWTWAASVRRHVDPKEPTAPDGTAHRTDPPSRPANVTGSPDATHAAAQTAADPGPPAAPDRLGDTSAHAGTMERLLNDATRARDPYWSVTDRRWIIRRLAPDCSRIELSDLPSQRDETKLLHAMGEETANLHLATRGAATAIARDLSHRPADWLSRAASAMVHDVQSDAAAWATSWRQLHQKVK